MMKKLLLLTYIFLKIGLFTIGGGLAILSVLSHELVDKKAWLSKEEFADLVAIAESTPGVIAVNAATFVGYKISGFFGALLSTIAVITPAFTIILIFSLFYDLIANNEIFISALIGIRIVVAMLILKVGINMIKKLDKNILSVFILLIVAILFFMNIPAIYLILGTGLIYLIISLLFTKKVKHA